jgi:hypothetical protein
MDENEIAMGHGMIEGPAHGFLACGAASHAADRSAPDPASDQVASGADMARRQGKDDLNDVIHGEDACECVHEHRLPGKLEELLGHLGFHAGTGASRRYDGNHSLRVCHGRHAQGRASMAHRCDLSLLKGFFPRPQVLRQAPRSGSPLRRHNAHPQSTCRRPFARDPFRDFDCGSSASRFGGVTAIGG